MNEIKEIRELLGLSRKQFGVFINRSSQSVQRYESGEFIPIEVLNNARKYKKLFLEITTLNEE